MSTWITVFSDVEDRESERMRQVAGANDDIWTELLNSLRACVDLYNKRHPLDYGQAVGVAPRSTSTERILEIPKTTKPEGKITIKFPINEGKLAFNRTGQEPGAGEFDIVISAGMPGTKSKTYLFRGADGRGRNVEGLLQELLGPLFFGEDTRVKGADDERLKPETFEKLVLALDAKESRQPSEPRQLQK